MNHGEDKNEDRELEAWRGQWQALGNTEDRAEMLVARAARDGRRMNRDAVVQVLGVVVSSAICSWLVVRTGGAAPVVAVTAIILLFNGAWLAHYLTLRAGLFASSGEGVDVYVVLTRKRLATELQWMGFARRWTFVLCAVLAPALVWLVLARWERYVQEPWRAVVGFGAAAAINVFVLFWMAHKARTLRAEQERFEQHVAGIGAS